MSQLRVVLIKSSLSSFAYNNGLYAIKEEVNGILHLWKIKDGKLNRYEDGKPNILCTSVNNTDVNETDLFVNI